MKIVNVKAEGLDHDIQKIILEDVDNYYYEYILEELENIIESRKSHKEGDNNNILALILANNLWTMTLNDFNTNEKIVLSHIVNSPNSISDLTSSIVHVSGKELLISTSGEEAKDVLYINDDLLYKYDFFLKTYIKDIDNLFDNVLQGENIEIQLLGGATKEKFINSKTNKLHVDDLLDVNQSKIIIELTKGVKTS